MSNYVLRSKFIFITGYPGVGKETVTDAICALSGAKKIGGHKLSAQFFEVAGYPVDELPSHILQDAFNRMHRLFRDLFDMAKQSPRGTSHVFTNWLTDDASGRAEELMRGMEDVASHRNTRLDIFVLVCTDSEEHMARLMVEDRKKQFKLTDPAVAQQIFDEPLYIPPNAQIINTAGRRPEDVAKEIIRRVNQPRPLPEHHHERR